MFFICIFSKQLYEILSLFRAWSAGFALDIVCVLLPTVQRQGRPTARLRTGTIFPHAGRIEFDSFLFHCDMRHGRRKSDIFDDWWDCENWWRHCCRGMSRPRSAGLPAATAGRHAASGIHLHLYLLCDVCCELVSAPRPPQPARQDRTQTLPW